MRLILLTWLAIILPFTPALATPLKADKTAARILVYFTVGHDEAPDSNVTIEQFNAHILELVEGGYKVLPLPEIVRAYETGKTLPPNSVVITFDGGDRSILKNAIPLLEQHKLPYTVFIATSRADDNDPRYLNWDDIKMIQKSSLATIGLHPEIYSDISHQTPAYIRSKVNNATARLREETSINTTLFAFPFGNVSQLYQDIISSYGFKAAFGQQSGVAHGSTDRFLLPRFTMTEDYANVQRFKMTIDALPLPVTDITPKVSHISNLEPALGFTVLENISNLNSLSCFASGQDKPSINIVGDARVEIRLKQPANDDRFRVNCTLPVEEDNDSETRHWRWFGFLMTLNEAILPEQETAEELENLEN